jgi:hypothetical protein
MAYTFGFYLYLFVASVVAGIGAVWLRPLGFTVNIIFAGVVGYLGGRCRTVTVRAQEFVAQ